MASVTEVLSFLRIFTSNASKATPAEKRKEFDEVLLSNMERFKDAFGRKGCFPQLEKHFEIYLTTVEVKNYPWRSVKTRRFARQEIWIIKTKLLT